MDPSFSISTVFIGLGRPRFVSFSSTDVTVSMPLLSTLPPFGMGKIYQGRKEGNTYQGRKEGKQEGRRDARKGGRKDIKEGRKEGRILSKDIELLLPVSWMPPVSRR